MPWVRDADNVVYCGDLDAEGFEILNHFRASLAQPGAQGAQARPVSSVLMDIQALRRYRDLGVSRDKNGHPIRRTAVHLTALTEEERTAYYELTTGGAVPVRRIEQERIPLAEAASAVRAVTGADPTGG